MILYLECVAIETPLNSFSLDPKRPVPSTKDYASLLL